MRQIGSPGSLYETGYSGLTHWDDAEGGDGEGGGRGLGWPWLIHVSAWQKPLQYYKVVSFQLK